MKKLTCLLFSLLFLGLPLAGCGGGESDDIKLGFLGATTGPTANYGIPGEMGMRMAIDEINAAGGILGRQLAGLYEDNKGQTSEITAIAQRYITRDQVAAMIGDTTTGLTKAAAKIAQDNQTVLFTPGATGDGVVEIGDYIYRNTLLDIFAAPAVVNWMIKDQGWTNFALVTSLNNGYSTALTPIFEQAVASQGGTIVISDTINDGETDFTAQITKLKAIEDNLDVLIFTGYYTEAALLMNEAAKKELDIVLVGGDGLYGLDLARLGGSSVEEKVIFYCGFSTDQPSEETERFLEAYRALYGEEPDMFSAQYYDAVYIIAQAMDQAGSAVPSEYKEYLNGLTDYPGVSGNTTFRDDREPIKSPVFLLTVRDGQFALVHKLPVETAAE
jgi:branched-chain amino acid transport system substrate-binding protein